MRHPVTTEMVGTGSETATRMARLIAFASAAPSIAETCANPGESIK